jgi:hypothetical protein
MAFGGEGGLHASKVRTYCSRIAMGLVAASIFSTQAVTLNLQPNWNLVGYSDGAPVNVADVFSNATDVTTVWKWIPATSKWAFYSPSFADGGAAYAASKGYDPLVTINNGDGFWVNAKTSFAATIFGTCAATQVLQNGVCVTPPVVFNKTYTYAATPPVPQQTPNGYPIAAGDYRSTHNMGIWEVADLRGTGREDVIYMPSFAPQYRPMQPLEIWLNNGDGTWDVDGANKLIVGGAPILGSAMARVGDLNGDGRPDILVGESNELGVCGSAADANGALCFGGRMVYLESQSDGKYIDASSKFASLGITTTGLSIASMNDDGVNDLLVVQNSSLRLFKNDGHANFTEQTYTLPDEIRYIPDAPTATWKGQTRFEIAGNIGQSFYQAKLVNLRGTGKPVLVTGSYGWDWGTDEPGAARFTTGTDSIRFFEQDANGNYVRTAMIVEDKTRGDLCGINILIPMPVSKEVGRENLLVMWEPPSGLMTPAVVSACTPMIYTSTGNTSTTSLAITELPNMVNMTDLTPKIENVVAFTGATRVVDTNNDGFVDIEVAARATIESIANGYVTRLYSNAGTKFEINPLIIGGVTQTSSTLAALTGTDPNTTVLPISVKYGPNQYGLLLMEGQNVADSTIDPTTGVYIWNTMRLHSILKID